MRLKKVRCINSAFLIDVGKIYTVIRTSQSYKSDYNPTGQTYELEYPRSFYYARHFEVIGCQCPVKNCIAKHK